MRKKLLLTNIVTGIHTIYTLGLSDIKLVQFTRFEHKHRLYTRRLTDIWELFKAFSIQIDMKPYE